VFFEIAVQVYSAGGDLSSRETDTASSHHITTISTSFSTDEPPPTTTTTNNNNKKHQHYAVFSQVPPTLSRSTKNSPSIPE
jgi:hypothetical protein